MYSTGVAKPKTPCKRNKFTQRDQRLLQHITLKTRNEEQEFAKADVRDVSTPSKSAGRRSSASTTKKENTDWLSTGQLVKERNDRDQRLKKTLKNFALNWKLSRKRKMESSRSATEDLAPDIWSRYALSDKRTFPSDKYKEYHVDGYVIQNYMPPTSIDQETHFVSTLHWPRTC